MIIEDADRTAEPDTTDAADAHDLPEDRDEALDNDESTDEELDDDEDDDTTGAVVTSDAPPAAPRLKMSWFVLHTYSGYEKKVATTLRERLRQHGMAEKVGDILVPEEDVVEVKSGKRRYSRRKFFPGYIVIEMVMDEKTWYVVKETPRVTGFLGDTHPIPLAMAEVVRLKEQLSGAAEKPRPKYEYEVGESIRITEGPFANFTGLLDEVNADRGKVKVMVSIFGRSTPVELEFSQIEKV